MDALPQIFVPKSFCGKVHMDGKDVIEMNILEWGRDEAIETGPKSIKHIECGGGGSGGGSECDSSRCGAGHRNIAQKCKYKLWILNFSFGIKL